MLSKNDQTKIILFRLVVTVFLLLPVVSHASNTDGTIQDQYAWGENAGWVNFLPTSGNIHVTDAAVTGYSWDANYGWINFAPDQSGVNNDGEGNLSGYAWSEGGGYIDFSGVIINSSGRFTGTAEGTVYGRLTFDCDECNVTTDWRPASSRSSSSGSSGSSGGGSIYNNYIAPIVNYFSPSGEMSASVGQNVNMNSESNRNFDSSEITDTENNRSSNSGQTGSTTVQGNQNYELNIDQGKTFPWGMPIWKITIIGLLVALIIFVLFRFLVSKI